VWEEELKDDIDRHYLLNGITEGFRISDVDVKDVKNVEQDNHSSTNKYRDQVESELLDQLKVGNYVITNTKPVIVSPLAAIMKDSGEVRLIHDASVPAGQALNDYSLNLSVKYQTLSEACQLASPDSYLCKVDLKAAYRSVPISPCDYQLTGIKWKFSGENHMSYMYDTRLLFGSNKGPGIFHRLTQSVRRMMKRKGFPNLVVYLDDFVYVDESFERCMEAQQVLLSLLIKLGFRISWQKVVSPTVCLEFLGIGINTVDCTLLLSTEKLRKLHNKLVTFQCKKRASKRQLKSLAGSLNWACQAINGGRFFLRRILDTINKLKLLSHKCKLSSDFQKDVQWWVQYLEVFNGVIYYRNSDRVVVHSDACQEGAGMFCRGDWYYVNWAVDLPRASPLHINYKEVLAITMAVQRWGETFRNCDVQVVTDSTVAKAIINKGHCKNGYIMHHMRKMFWTMMANNIRVRAIHIPGVLNNIPDAISRILEPGQWLRLRSLLGSWYHGYYDVSFSALCHVNMSSLTFQMVTDRLTNRNSNVS
jgi:hypothetical protein